MGSEYVEPVSLEGTGLFDRLSAGYHRGEGREPEISVEGTSIA